MMCLACEQAEMYYRYEILQHVARGEMPPGMTEADLRRMGFPLPGEVPVAPKAGDPAQDAPSAPNTCIAGPAPDAFVCDSPDGE